MPILWTCISIIGLVILAVTNLEEIEVNRQPTLHWIDDERKVSPWLWGLAWFYFLCTTTNLILWIME